MKVLRYLVLLFAIIFSFSESFAEARFYKANSVRIKYLYWLVEASDVDPNRDKVWFAEMWTGNDTIVDGYSCVTLWDQDEGEEPKLVGCLREDENGYVWRYYWDYSKLVGGDSDWISKQLEYCGLTNNWAFLYDFSNPDWKNGIAIEVGSSDPNGHRTIKLYGVEDRIIAENGEEIPRAQFGFLIYGIGNTSTLFESRLLGPASRYGTTVLEYWRDGELLLKNYMITEEIKKAMKIESVSMPQKVELYDLTGRPADGTQKGILIRNGKKVLVK